MIIVRFADDFIMGFEHEADARRCLADLRQRLAKFGLALHPDKTRLVEFGRYAARNRAARGLGKPETFDFLGFTHICGKTREGAVRVAALHDLEAVAGEAPRGQDAELLKRRHLPVPEQGRWLASVVRGHLAYYAVPGNSPAVNTFRREVIRHWSRALRRRSQRTRLTWERMNRLAKRWLPPVRITHPWPSVRFDARTRGRSPVR